MERRLTRTVGSPGSVLVWSKLTPPAPRAGTITRSGLQSLLQAGLEAKLCLLDAPAGSGKTTLLAQWSATAGAGRVAWVSLDEGDNDPARLWIYISEALRTVEPGVGTATLQALRRPSVDFGRSVLPPLLNDLNGIGSPLVLVLDDYHLITDPRLPAGGRLLPAPSPGQGPPAAGDAGRPAAAPGHHAGQGRAGRAPGRRAPVQRRGGCRPAERSDGAGADPVDVARLAERTEGWAAGLYLAGLSLRGREEPGAFIAAFHGDHRHVADYLAADVLARQPEAVRTFLLRSSVLRRLSGPLCDDVLEREGSGELLEELERSNLFLVPLDDRRRWYRYHQLFGELLRLELSSREPALIPALHRRAAAWHTRGGDVEEAIHHATAAGELTDAGALIASNWLAYWRRGRRATVTRWVDGLPEEAIMADPPVAFVAAWIGGYSGASKQECERWLDVVEAADWQGALPDGISSLAFGAALTRASVPFDNAGCALEAAQRALELAGPEPSAFHWMAQAALGHALYLAGRPAEARPPLEALAVSVHGDRQPYAVMTALAVLSLLASDDGDDDTAASLAGRAMATAEAMGLSAEPLSGIVHMALGRVLTRQGRLAQAQEQLEWSLELFAIDGMALYRAQALLLLAAVRHGRDDLAGARHLLEHAHALIDQLADPGGLPSLLQQSRRTQATFHRRAQVAAPLTQRELAVLRLLPSRLSTRKIGDELHVSVNTIRSQVQAVYRKLDVAGRAEAVTEARRLGLLPGSSPEHDDPTHLDEFRSWMRPAHPPAGHH